MVPAGGGAAGAGIGFSLTAWTGARIIGGGAAGWAGGAAGGFGGIAATTAAVAGPGAVAKKTPLQVGQRTFFPAAVSGTWSNFWQFVQVTKRLAID